MKKTRKASAVDRLLIPTKQSMLGMLKQISGESTTVNTLSNLESIRSVKTKFTGFNRAIVLQGAPLGATYVIHGPPGGGKTALALALASSFVKLGHPAAYIDAEYALSKEWAVHLKTETDGILCERPESFEGAVDQVDKWIENFKRGKANNIIPEDRTFCIVVDTIHKLVPKREIAQLKSENKGMGAENINKGWGMLRANMIASWIDHMTPIVGKNQLVFIALAHEKEDKNDDWSKPDYKVKGGTALLFEAMVRIRVSEARKIYEEKKGKKRIIGKEHGYTIEKNKVGYPHEYAKFYIGNGKGSMPLGFDLEREAYVEADYRGMIKKSGSYIYLPIETEQPKLQGMDNAISWLRTNTNAMEELTDVLNDSLATPENYEYEKETEQ